MTIIVTGGAGFIGSNFIFHMLDAYPHLKAMYSAEDENTEVLYFEDATATFASFGAPSRSFQF